MNKKGNILLPIISAIAVLALIAAGYFFWSSFAKAPADKQNQEQGSNSNSPTPTPTIKIETANWKILETKIFSLKHPPELQVAETPLSTKVAYSFLGPNMAGGFSIIVGTNYDQNLQRQRTYDEELKLSGKDSIRKSVNIAGKDYAKFIGKDLTQTILIKSPNDEIIWLEYNPNGNIDVQSFDQILSTFKFTNQN